MMLKKIYKIIIVSMMISMSFVALVHAEDTTLYGTKTADDFKNAIFGELISSATIPYIQEKYPDVTIQYFNEISDVFVAMSTGKVDATVLEKTIFVDAHRSIKNIKMLEESFCSFEQAFIISPESSIEDNNILLNELNEYIKKSKENGYVNSLIDKWTIDFDEDFKYNNVVIKNPKKILKVVVSPTPPYSFILNEKIAGFDVEFFENFCKEYNYGYQYEYVDFTSLIVGITTNKYDIGIGGITMTEERKKNMIFADSHFTETAHVIYYENDTKIPLLDKIKSSFYNSFIKESRYTLILNGLLVTLFITILSIVCGVIIGFFMYLLYINGIKILNILINIYVYIMNGIPLLVFLMVLYYIVFSGRDVSGVIISIVGFSLAMGVFVFGSLVDYTKILDKGQEEASLALGYKKIDVFYKIVMPQIIINIFPSFKNRVVFLLKNTAIVGYIAVVDLTRAGDIIRSRTYEAIFPLLSIATIYFIVGVIMKAILSKIEKKLNPRNRTNEQILRRIQNE